MTDKHVHDALHTLSDVAVTDDAQLWQDIRQELEHKQATLQETMTMNGSIKRFPRYLLVAAILLVSSVAAFAMSQIIDVDDGLRGDRAAQLVTQVDAAIMLYGNTVTLEWAYADANRIVFAYNVTDEQGNAITDADFLEQIDLSAEVALDGYPDPTVQHIRNLDFGRVYDVTPVIDSNSRIGIYRIDYPMNFVTDEQGLFELTLRIFGGTGDYYTSYNFDVLLPFYEAQFELTESPRFESNINLSLTDFVITQSMISMEVCYTSFLGTSDSRSVPNAITVTFDGDTVLDSRVRVDAIQAYYRYSDLDNYVCNGLAWAAATDLLPETVTITIDGIYETDPSRSEDATQRMVDLFRERGVEIELGTWADGSYYLDFPSSWLDLPRREQRRIYAEVMDAFWVNPVGVEHVEGPFTLTIQTADFLNTETAFNR